ncbi:MAG: helix-turn-helix domain-containing protein [Mycobacteriaceae bacterium]
MSATFAERLNKLFATVYPPDRGPHSSAEVITALRAEGIKISPPYLSQLRSGSRDNPSYETMRALAGFFRIEIAYFTNDDYAHELDTELYWLDQMRNKTIQRIVKRTIGLSSAAQQKIILELDRYRIQEGLELTTN